MSPPTPIRHPIHPPTPHPHPLSPPPPTPGPVMIQPALRPAVYHQPAPAPPAAPVLTDPEPWWFGLLQGPHHVAVAALLH